MRYSIHQIFESPTAQYRRDSKMMGSLGGESGRVKVR